MTLKKQSTVALGEARTYNEYNSVSSEIMFHVEADGHITEGRSEKQIKEQICRTTGGAAPQPFLIYDNGPMATNNRVLVFAAPDALLQFHVNVRGIRWHLIYCSFFVPGRCC